MSIIFVCAFFHSASHKPAFHFECLRKQSSQDEIPLRPAGLPPQHQVIVTSLPSQTRYGLRSPRLISPISSQVKKASGQEAGRARLSPTRSIRSWVTPPATPPPYTALVQTTLSASSTPGLVHRGFWSQPGSDWSARSPSLLKVPPRLSGHHLQQRSSAHSLVEAVSDRTLC